MSVMTLIDKQLLLCSQYGQTHAQSEYCGFNIIQAVLDASAVSAGIGLSRNASSASSTRKEEERCGSCGKTLCSYQMRKIKKRRRLRQKEQGHSRRTCRFCSSRSLISSLADRVVCGRKGRARAKDDQSIVNCSVSIGVVSDTVVRHLCTKSCHAYLLSGVPTQDHIHTERELHLQALVTRESSCQLFHLNHHCKSARCRLSPAAWR